MFVKVLKEAGYEEALLGLSLSFYDHKIPLVNWDNLGRYTEGDSPLEGCRVWDDLKDDGYFWTDEKYVKAQHRAEVLAFKGGGHNKFLESIVVWLYIQAPRCFWSEYDTYRVGMSKNSSSTMHTLDKRSTTLEDYEEETYFHTFNLCLIEYKDPNSKYYKNITYLKCNLPEGWLQERQICTNYMTLQNIINQRKGHRLKYWNQHNEAILSQIAHPELLYRN